MTKIKKKEYFIWKLTQNLFDGQKGHIRNITNAQRVKKISIKTLRKYQRLILTL